MFFIGLFVSLLSLKRRATRISRSLSLSLSFFRARFSRPLRGSVRSVISQTRERIATKVRCRPPLRITNPITTARSLSPFLSPSRTLPSRFLSLLFLFFYSIPHPRGTGTYETLKIQIDQVNYLSYYFHILLFNGSFMSEGFSAVTVIIYFLFYCKKSDFI